MSSSGSSLPVQRSASMPGADSGTGGIPTSPPTHQQHLPARSSPLAAMERRSVSSTDQPTLASRARPRALGRAKQLRAEVDAVVKRRAGGVLGRGFILKTDHYPTGRALDLDLNVQGAPNFRAPHEEGLNVFGVAQPTVPGLKSILTILSCQPRSTTPVGSPESLMVTATSTAAGRRRSSTTVIDLPGHTIWFSTREETLVYMYVRTACSGRPYVLRDASTPLKTLALSDRADNLEDIERRLKLDILEESRRYGGLILCHDEVAGGEIVPAWVAVDERSIKTPKEIFEDIRNQGWRVDYWRIPVGPDRPIEDNYLDAYASRLKDVDPLTSSLVFNCGMGVVRTTFAMCAALLVRRAQYLKRGLDDPFPLSSGSGFSTPSGAPGTATPQAAQVMQQLSQQKTLNTSLLKVTRMLDESLPSRRSTAAIDLLSTHPKLLDSLRSAHMGNYQIVLSLISSLDHGRELKRLVDMIIDDCDAVVNLREIVIEYRIKYSVVTHDNPDGQWYLDKAVRSLEQYFDLIVFAAYVESDQGLMAGVKFSTWLKARTPRDLEVLRRRWGDRLFAFAPANDLSVISKALDHREGSSRRREDDLEGGRVLGDEWAEHVVKSRTGIMLRASTLLKRDLWKADTASSTDGVRGAHGFRQVSGTTVYTTGQPTQEAISTILGVVKERTPNVSKVVWICLREEPLVMINGAPYCLRRDTTALRNMRDYTGVSAARLEFLEERLKSDVVAELDAFGGTLLLHSETSDGKVVPLWEKVNKDDVESIRQVMDDVELETTDVNLIFERVPITSESSPDFHDLTQLLDVCTRIDMETTAIILNDQLGRGRSSNTAAIILLIQRWLKRSRDPHPPSTPAARRSASRSRLHAAPASTTSWQIINSCLRVIRNGSEVKRVVDEAIDRTSATFNLRDAIEEYRDQAEDAKTPEARAGCIDRGMHSLLRYFHLIVFQAYLDDTQPDDKNAFTFESFVKHRPVFKTLQTELLQGGIASLTPLERAEPAEGMALEDEVSHVVANRTGTILSAQTILKSDFFLGLQKQSLPERVDGAANYRKVPLLLDEKLNKAAGDQEHFVYGTGMPSSQGLRNALIKMGAGPDGPRKILWTSLREEPVLYVNGRPHVLRLVDKPLTNVETTGVTAHVVERMEDQFKADVLKEIRQHGGKLLLHDEMETKPGVYEVIPIWENVEPENVMTPAELYKQVENEHYHVDYMRLAITDEQAPLPAALQAIVNRVVLGLKQGDDFVFNCQMGRGRTTTGMIAASLIATIAQENVSDEVYASDDEAEEDEGDVDLTEAMQYLNGEYKTILQLVTVLRHGKEAKHLTDRAINAMDGVQNLRKAVYDFKLKVAAAEPGSTKFKTLMHQGVNYLYRYGALIVLANFLLECKEQGIPFAEARFPEWLQKHREISNVLSRKTLD